MNRINSLRNYVARIAFAVGIAAAIAAAISFLTGCSATMVGMPSQAEREAYIAQWRLQGKEARYIREGKIWIGATWRDVHAAIGKPDSVRTIKTGRHHYLTMRYPCHNLYFLDGVLESIQDAYRCSGAAPNYPPPALPYPNFGVRRL